MSQDQESMSWEELVGLTHDRQVEIFNWCSCEELDEWQEPPYRDCPNPKFIAYDMVCPDCDCLMTQITRREPYAKCSCGGDFTLIQAKESKEKWT